MLPGCGRNPNYPRHHRVRPPTGKPGTEGETPRFAAIRDPRVCIRLLNFPARPPLFLLIDIVISALIESLADVTSHRDRDEVDCAIAAMLFSHVHPARVCVYRVLRGEGDEPVESRRVQLRAVADAAGARTVGSADGTGADRQGLPTIGSRVPWGECVQRADAVHYVADDIREPGSVNTVLPIMADHGLIGLLEIELHVGGAFLRPADIRLVQAVLRILRNHLSVLDYGERDTLTGLLNRRTFETRFAKRRVSCHRAGDDHRAGARTNWIGIVDVARFKTINDTFGHLFGDEVLLLIARRMQETFRHSETLFRFGGEEFLVILDDAEESGAMTAFERFRKAIEGHRFPQIGQVTVSIGITRIDPYDIPASAVDRADSALYFAKEHGRNRTLAYEALVRDGLLSRKAVQAAELELF